jgi:DNA-binding Xre family transcriptional regulator
MCIVPVMETFTAQQLVARNVRRIRELPDRDRSQAQLARQLGWSKQKLSKLETSDRGISVDELLALAMALHVAPAVLLTPWDDDEALVVAMTNVETHLDGPEAFGWIVGAPAPDTLAMVANPRSYFSTTPAAIQRRYGVRWFKQVREQLGWEVSDDGTVVTRPGISVRWGEGHER